MDLVKQTIERDTFDDLLAVLHLAEVLNNRQHAGTAITPTMWSEMHQRTNAARASLHREAETLLSQQNGNLNAWEERDLR